MRVRVAESVAIMMIGDGVIGALFPRRHVLRWLRGPTVWRRVMRPFADRPGLTRALAAAQVGAGVWWAARLPADSS